MEGGLIPPIEELNYLADRAFEEDIRSLRTRKDDELIRLVVFGYKVCNMINNFKDVDVNNAEDEGWKEVFAEKCRKMPQVMAWIEEVLRIAGELAAKPGDDDDWM